MRTLRVGSANEAGVAFVISILVLFVLTVLGLALMVVTATEAQIAVNHRWGEMAFYNADAGLELAKNVLASYSREPGAQQFQKALPQARLQGAMGSPPPGTAEGRDYQYSVDDAPGVKVYIGKVLTDPGTGKRYEFDFRKGKQAGLKGGDVDGDDNADVQGTVTVWVRRPIVAGRDYEGNDRVVITAEGTAPNYEGYAGRASALRRLEMTVRVQSGTVLASIGHANAMKGSDTLSAPTSKSASTDVTPVRK